MRNQTLTTDIEGMALAVGVLTGSGGRTSHAVVVARQLGKVCLVGCPDLKIDMEHRRCYFGGKALNEGDLISLDGNTGSVYLNRISTITEHPVDALCNERAYQVVLAVARLQQCQSNFGREKRGR